MVSFALDASSVLNWCQFQDVPFYLLTLFFLHVPPWLFYGCRKAAHLQKHLGTCCYYIANNLMDCTIWQLMWWLKMLTSHSDISPRYWCRYSVTNFSRLQVLWVNWKYNNVRHIPINNNSIYPHQCSWIKLQQLVSIFLQSKVKFDHWQFIWCDDIKDLYKYLDACILTQTSPEVILKLGDQELSLI